MGQTGDIEGVVRLNPDVIFTGSDNQGSILSYTESGVIDVPYVVISEYLGRELTFYEKLPDSAFQ
jgi:ABC-type Fe3+-hydroxamate transport system substrate-binding protein